MVKVVTDGRNRWLGEGRINTGRGPVDVASPPEWASVFDASFLDRLEGLRRGPQSIHPKDVGTILSLTGPERGWRVAEGGAGSGYLTAWLARLVKRVYSYELREDHLRIARENIGALGFRNVTFRQGSVFELKERGLDMVVYDLPNPWEGVDAAKRALRTGGYFVCYLPTAPQVERLLSATRDFSEKRVVTSVWWDWKTEPDRFRPKSKTLAHTAFIFVARKFR